MEGYERSTYGDRFADVYDDWYPDVTDTDGCVELVAGLAAAAGSSVVELGVGTGRLAVPLAGRGLRVTGVDASRAMLDRAAAKPGGEALRLVEADMAAPPLGDERFGVVLLAYNTLFNLVAEGDQARCLGWAAVHLAPVGSLLVEAFVPEADRPTAEVVPREITADRVVLSVSRSDPDAQEAMGQYVDITEAGIRLRPWHVRWSTPAQLDAAADEAGLRLADRWAGWRHEPFTDESPVHVSRYVLAP